MFYQVSWTKIGYKYIQLPVFAATLTAGDNRTSKVDKISQSMQSTDLFINIFKVIQIFSEQIKTGIKFLS